MIFKKTIFISFLLGGLFLPFFVSAVEKIDSFYVTIKINPDSSINVSERIDYDFGQSQRHGIYRNIPIKYKARGGNYNLRISNISIVDESGNPYTFKKSYPGSDINIRIGDEDKLVIGKKTYVINYTIKRAINYFNTHDELYWNATGNNWQVNIESAFVEIILPEEINHNQIQKECFFGFYGSNFECESNISNIDGKTIISYEHFFQLAPGQGMTIVAGFPKNIVVEPTIFQKALDIVIDNGILLLPILIFGFLFYRWYKYGRDPKGKGTICAQYNAPDKLTPLEIGIVLDERFDNKDLSAEIINLAVKGYLKIKKEVKKKFILKTEDFILTKLKDEKSLKNNFERKIMKSIFGNEESIKLSDLKNKFYKDLKDIKKQVYEIIVEKGYFPKNPNKVRAIYLIISIAVGIFIFPAGILLGSLGVFSITVSSIIIFIFSFIMPRKTKKGTLAKEHILGLKEYLIVAEEDRIKFHNTPKKNPKHFEKLLPFAIVLGVEKEWAKKFEAIYTTSPDWYEDSHITRFNSIIFINNLSNFSKSASASLASSPSSASSGGSGFSGGGVGGGFGGGGGGSW